MPHGGLALANSFATALEATALFIFMRKRLNGIEGGQTPARRNSVRTGSFDNGHFSRWMAVFRKGSRDLGSSSRWRPAWRWNLRSHVMGTARS